MSFLIEALLLSFAGGILGCLITLPLNSVTTGVGNFFTFSEIAFHFRVGLSTMAIGVIFAAIVGAIEDSFRREMLQRRKSWWRCMKPDLDSELEGLHIERLRSRSQRNGP